MGRDKKYSRDGNRIRIKKDEFKKLTDREKLAFILLTPHGRNLFIKLMNKLLETNMPLEFEPCGTMFEVNDYYVFIAIEKGSTIEAKISVKDLPFELMPYELEEEFKEILKEIVANEKNQEIVVDALSEIKKTMKIDAEKSENPDMEM